ncbi:dopamine N-acetyltransferase-like [Drosophila obscura]|uniref:dopamine N-acetyltransferase-like n=1 Tax=Drosophila obscura TaxID=7282 RepID=UPI001BB1E778|nr:dopamine N-acetyltransferase-like [Drosophila obscura]
MTLADYETIKHIFEEQFINGEPLFNSITGPIDPEMWNLYDEYHQSMIAAGTSVVAIDDEEKDGRVVGFVLAEGQSIDDVEKHRQEAECIPDTDIIGHIKRIISKVEVEANIYERYGVSRLLYSHLTSVDVSMRGKGLGSRLATSAMDLGRSKGYPLMTAFCSSFYSARQKEAMGMECIYSLKFEDYKDTEGKVVFTPPEPHKEIRVVAIKL